MLGDSHVYCGAISPGPIIVQEMLTFGVGSLILSSFLLGCHLLLNSTDVLLVDVGDIVWIWVRLGSLNSPLGFLVNIVEIGIGLSEGVTNLFLEDLLDDWTHDHQQDRLGNTEEEFMVGLLDLDLQVFNIDGDLVNLGKVLTIFLVSSRGSDLEAEAFTAQEDIHHTGVSDGGESLLLLDMVRNIFEIHLDTRGRDHDLVVMFVADLLAAPAEVVIAAKFENIWCKVVAFDDQVFHHSIDHWVGHLDARDGNIASVLENGGQDDSADIFEKMLLEHWLAILIVTQILEQSLHGQSESLVLRVLVKLISKKLGFIDDAVGVIAVSFTEEELSMVVQLVPFFIGLILENEALLFQTFADEFVDRLEPVLQFWIAVGIGVDVLDGFEEIFGAGAIGEALNQSLDFGQRFFVCADGS